MPRCWVSAPSALGGANRRQPGDQRPLNESVNEITDLKWAILSLVSGEDAFRKHRMSTTIALANALLDPDENLNRYGLMSYHPIAQMLQTVLTTEFNSNEDAITFIATVDGLMIPMEATRRVKAWSLLCKIAYLCDSLPIWPLVKGLEKHPDAVSPTLATALCLLIDDPNHEDCIQRLLARVPVVVLDHESVANACLRAFDCHRRHADVALSVFERLSVGTLYLVSDEITAHIKSMASNKKRLRRIEKLVMKIEAPGGEAYKRYLKASTVHCSDQGRPDGGSALVGRGVD
jgi:hypothetical protein